MLAEVVSLFAPPVCVACRSPLPGPVADLCPACRQALPRLEAPCCPRCALPAPCAPCPARGAAFAGAWAPMAHEGTARALVGALKFAGALGLADLMAAQVVAAAPDALMRGPGVLVPVPAHPARRRERGFDQARRLADALGRRTGLAVSPCLRRGGPATRQLGAGRRARSEPGRVAVTAAGTVPSRAVLVDDVHTTGATLDACARALRLAGADDVRALTYTRALKG